MHALVDRDHLAETLDMLHRRDFSRSRVDAVLHVTLHHVPDVGAIEDRANELAASCFKTSVIFLSASLQLPVTMVSHIHRRRSIRMVL